MENKIRGEVKEEVKSYSKSFDVLGNIAILKFPQGAKETEKKKRALRIIQENRGITTVLEKTGKFSGRLRKLKTKFLAGEKTREVLYRENGCSFRFNIDTSYFSPRLAGERKEVAEMIKKDEEVLVMCAGVAPYPIVIAKNSKAKKVYSNEINREANKYAELNIGLNNLKGKVELVSGDIKKVAPKLVKEGKTFDVIIMARPQLKDSFLKEAFMLSKTGKKGTRIYYYGFCFEEEIPKMIEMIKDEAKKAEKEIKILKFKKAGEIGSYRYRIRVDLKIIS